MNFEDGGYATISMILTKIKEIAAQYPDNLALIYNDHKIDYAQFVQIVHKLANGLRNAGISSGDRVAITLPNLPHYIFSYFAVLEAGAVVVPINYLLPQDELIHVLENSNPKAIIYWDGFLGNLIDFFKRADNTVIKIVLGKKKKIDNFVLTDLISSSSAEELNIETDANSTAVIQYTAGVDDVPVGAEFSHKNLFASTESILDFFRFTANDVFGCLLPLFINANQNVMVNSALTLGGTIVLYPKLDLLPVADSIDKHKVTTIMGSPNFFNKLAQLKAEEINGSSLKNCLSILSHLPEEISLNFYNRFKEILLNGYTVTESGGLSAAMHPSFDNLLDSVGVALPGVEIQIHDPHGEQLLNEKIGEVALRGNTIFNKYWQNENLTSSRFKNGWFYPGDFGKKSADGYITIIDRKSDVILKSGFDIHATEIEQILMSHPKVKDAAVISVPHPDYKEDVLAFVVPEVPDSILEQEIVEFCRAQFPVYKCPQGVRFISELPKTKMGRVLKRKLKTDK